MTFKPVERGPQIGAPPSLEQIAVDRLQVDRAYQRAAEGPQSRRIIAGMVRQWDWSLCQPLVVSRRDGGGLFVLDGQHRLAGARERGDIAYLPCVVLAGVTQDDEARAFVEINTRRQKLSEADKFFGLLAAGDPAAVHASTIMERTGWRPRRSNGSARQSKPGDLNSAPMIVAAVRSHGVGRVEWILRVLRQAWPQQTVAPFSRLFHALVPLAPPSASSDTAAAAAALGGRAPEDWIAAGAVLAREAELPARAALTEEISEALIEAAAQPRALAA